MFGLEQSTMQLMTTPGLAFGDQGPRAQGQGPDWPLATQGPPKLMKGYALNS